MKKLICFLVLFAAIGGSLRAQQPQVASSSNPQGANLTASDTGACTTAQACVWQRLPSNAGTTTVNLAGTFTATLLVEQSNNGGGTWATVATLSAVGTTTYISSGFTDVRVRCSAFTSGPVQVSISTGILQVQSVVSGSGSGTANLNSVATVFAANAPYNAKFNVLSVTDATYTNVSATVTCPNSDCNFTSANVGMLVKGTNRQGDTGVLTTPTQSCFPSGTTIQTFNNANSVTLSQANTCGNVTAVGNFAWGNDDTTPLTNAWNAASALCGVLVLPAGGKAFVNAGLFNTTSPCSNGGGPVAARIIATVTALGTGPSTYLIPLTGFPASSCNGPNGGGVICFGAGAGALSNFSIDGMGETALGAGFNGKIGVSPAVIFNSNPQLVNMELSAWGTTTSAFLGEQIPNTASSGQVINVQNDGFGFNNCQFSSSGVAQTIVIGSFCAVGGGINLQISGLVSSTNSIYGFNNSTTVDQVVVQSGGVLTSTQDSYPYQTGGANRAAIQCFGGSIFLNQATINNTTSGGLAISNFSGACDIHVKQSTVAATTPVDLVNVSATGKFYDEGGNKFTGGPFAVAAGGIYMTSPTSTYTSMVGLVPSCAATTGGTACSLLAGSTNEKGTVRITASAVATGTVTLTFIGTFTGQTGATPSSCGFSYANAGGTGSWSLTTTTPIVLTTRSSTVPVFNWNNGAVLTAASTYDIDYCFTPR